MRTVLTYTVTTCILLPQLVKSVSNGTGYVECNQGTLNVILAAPHGGYDQPASVPDRDAGCYIGGMCAWNHTCGTKDTSNCKATTVRDSFTKELTELMTEYLQAATGKRPHTVICNLARTKLDANRESDEATFMEALPTEVYDEFHQCINQARSSIEADTVYQGRGLLLDIHGHGHPNNWAELGYLLSRTRLDTNDIDADSTSIRSLANRYQGTFEAILRGNQSFGHFLEAEGFTSVPSPTHPGPSGQAYFSGGYTTRVHGSVSGGNIDAIQIESSYTNRAAAMRPTYAQALTNAITNFTALHYQATTSTDTTSTDPSIMTTQGSLGSRKTYCGIWIFINYWIFILLAG